MSPRASRAWYGLVLLATAFGCEQHARDSAGSAPSASSGQHGAEARAPAQATSETNAPAELPKGACRTLSADCGATEYCDFEPGLCGKGKTAGSCKARPAACDHTYAPVCGCDHKVYENECAARAAGIDLDVNGGCEKIPDYMACGRNYCDARTSYCEIVLSDVAELPTDYTCKPLPAACRPQGNKAADCSCFPKGTRCLSFCGPITTGSELSGIHLTCRL